MELIQVFVGQMEYEIQHNIRFAEVTEVTNPVTVNFPLFVIFSV